MEERKKLAAAKLASRKRGPARTPKITGRKTSVATREAINAIESNRGKTQ